MPSKKVDSLEKKKPYNLSIRTATVLAFDSHCADYAFNKNTLIESFMEEYLLEFKK
tara:strand:+ start:49 stop:216 length:168 start_codon:yes stop_codon:yes gene_type:complete